jgi:hypothetical protein
VSQKQNVFQSFSCVHKLHSILCSHMNTFKPCSLLKSLFLLFDHSKVLAVPNVTHAQWCEPLLTVVFNTPQLCACLFSVVSHQVAVTMPSGKCLGLGSEQKLTFVLLEFCNCWPTASLQWPEGGPVSCVTVPLLLFYYFPGTSCE